MQTGNTQSERNHGHLERKKTAGIFELWGNVEYKVRASIILSSFIRPDMHGFTAAPGYPCKHPL